jgi:hypothetical protein
MFRENNIDHVQGKTTWIMCKGKQLGSPAECHLFIKQWIRYRVINNIYHLQTFISFSSTGPYAEITTWIICWVSSLHVYLGNLSCSRYGKMWRFQKIEWSMRRIPWWPGGGIHARNAMGIKCSYPADAGLKFQVRQRGWGKGGGQK